jgi:hypothetical protein
MPRDQEAVAISTAITAALGAIVLAMLTASGSGVAPSAAAGSPAPPACSEWTDGCVVCARTPEGLACSTPGIACTRSAVQCIKP